jgi:hypothetical protein
MIAVADDRTTKETGLLERFADYAECERAYQAAILELISAGGSVSSAPAAQLDDLRVERDFVHCLLFKELGAGAGPCPSAFVTG